MNAVRSATRSEPAGRELLLLAGSRWAREGGLAALDEEFLEREAGVPAGAFAASYASLRALKLDLVRHLLDEIRSEVTQEIGEHNAGLPRLRMAMYCWLDGNLARPGLRELLAELDGETSVVALTRARIKGFAYVAQLELASVSWPRPAAVAELIVAMVVETAHAESEAGRPLPGFRTTLTTFLKSQ